MNPIAGRTRTRMLRACAATGIVLTLTACSSVEPLDRATPEPQPTTSARPTETPSPTPTPDDDSKAVVVSGRFVADANGAVIDVTYTVGLPIDAASAEGERIKAEVRAECPTGSKLDLWLDRGVFLPMSIDVQPVAGTPAWPAGQEIGINMITRGAAMLVGTATTPREPVSGTTRLACRAFENTRVIGPGTSTGYLLDFREVFWPSLPFDAAHVFSANQYSLYAGFRDPSLPWSFNALTACEVTVSDSATALVATTGIQWVDASIRANEEGYDECGVGADARLLPDY